MKSGAYLSENPGRGDLAMLGLWGSLGTEAQTLDCHVPRTLADSDHCDWALDFSNPADLPNEILGSGGDPVPGFVLGISQSGDCASQIRKRTNPCSRIQCEVGACK